MSENNWALCPKCKTNTPEKGVTLREDYEQGIDEDGVYFVCYDCRCEICGFSFQFRHSEPVLKSP